MMKSQLIYILLGSLWLTISAEDTDYNLKDSDEANPQSKSKGVCGTTLSMDEYIDEILDGVRTAIPDPLDLPDKGSVIQLLDGKLFGLSTLYRSGHSSIDCSQENMKMSSFLTTEFLLASFNWKYGTRFLTVNGILNITSKDFEVFTEMVRYTENRQDRVELTRFDITKLEKLEVKTTGVGPVTWLFSKITTLVSPLFRSQLEIALEGTLKEIINKKLKST